MGYLEVQSVSVHNLRLSQSEPATALPMIEWCELHNLNVCEDIAPSLW